MWGRRAKSALNGSGGMCSGWKQCGTDMTEAAPAERRSPLRSPADSGGRPQIGAAGLGRQGLQTQQGSLEVFEGSKCGAGDAATRPAAATERAGARRPPRAACRSRAQISFKVATVGSVGRASLDAGAGGKAVAGARAQQGAPVEVSAGDTDPSWGCVRQKTACRKVGKAKQRAQQYVHTPKNRPEKRRLPWMRLRRNALLQGGVGGDLCWHAAPAPAAQCAPRRPPLDADQPQI
ncbi:MAG: hypothetical protein J3K34DRAFT_436742 [Monoraphidium minutum]|nr:MAG: hypothetical protein J3K34DRAFT_436742 [Monoraphidium minutum]